MYRLSRVLLAAVPLLASATPLAAQAPASFFSADRLWRDPSPHAARLVGVAPGVRLEVLDWGGTGVPLVLLSGLGNTAHVYDGFAPKLTDRFRVYAVSRRGYGRSSQPASGYDVGTLAHDVRAVLDSLGVARAVLVGHSIAGDELTRFAADYPERVAALVYLDAAHDRSRLLERLEDAPPPPPPPPTEADLASPEAYRAFVARSMRLPSPEVYPEAEVRATAVFGPDGALADAVTPASIGEAILRGVERPRYAQVSAPALAIYMVTDSVQDRFPGYAAMDPDTRAAALRSFLETVEWADASRAQFRREVARGRVVELHGARHHVYMSHEEEVLREMRAFLSGALAAAEAAFAPERQASH
jgi:pimeloyl-ACP methyl ester carboxylesterase